MSLIIFVMDLELTEVALEIIEIQTGNYLGEDDIVRLEDDYNRYSNLFI
jgi:hypothetical protein